MIGAIMGAVGGVAEMAGGLIGQRGRKKEQRAARGQYDERMAEFENLDTSNLAGNLSNPYEDATVNTQGADYLAQQQQQASANMMSNMSGAAGGSGIAALAQTMANQQGQQLQAASANIADQEQSNQQAFMGQEARNQTASVAGASAARGLEYEKSQALTQAAGARKAAAEGAVNDARQAIIGGIGDIAGGVASAAMGGATPEVKTP
jgi:hypothetical protein